MPGLEIKLVAPKDALEEVRSTLRGREITGAISGALNKTLPKTRTEIIRTVRAELNLKASDVRERITILRASPGKLRASIRVSRKAIPLVKYNARQTRLGASVGVRKGSRQTILHSFLATMKSGHKGVFVREKDYKHVKRTVVIRQLLGIVGTGQHGLVEVGRKRVSFGLPIRELYGPTVVGVITGKPGMSEHLEQFASADLGVQLRSQIDRFLAKRPVETA